MEEVGRRCSVVREGLLMRMRRPREREVCHRSWVAKKRRRLRKGSWHGPVQPSPGKRVVEERRFAARSAARYCTREVQRGQAKTNWRRWDKLPVAR